MNDQPAGRYGLTGAQFEALATAWEQGSTRFPARSNSSTSLRIWASLIRRSPNGYDGVSTPPFQDTLMVDDEPAELIR